MLHDPARDRRAENTTRDGMSATMRYASRCHQHECHHRSTRIGDPRFATRLRRALSDPPSRHAEQHRRGPVCNIERELALHHRTAKRLTIRRDPPVRRIQQKKWCACIRSRCPINGSRYTAANAHANKAAVSNTRAARHASAASPTPRHGVPPAASPGPRSQPTHRPSCTKRRCMPSVTDAARALQ